MLKSIFYWFFPFLEKRNLSFFTDCSDNNAKARVFAHLSHQLKQYNFDIAVYGEQSVKDIAFNIFSLVSFWKQKNIKGNIVVGNYAPRSVDYPNGAPFLISIIEGNYIIGNEKTFALLKKIGFLYPLRVAEIDILNTLSTHFPKEDCVKLSKSQFRSLEVLPLIINLIVRGKQISTKECLIKTNFFSTPEVIFIDIFGNIKTSMEPNSLTVLKIDKTEMKIGDYEGSIPLIWDNLSEVPNNQPGFVAFGSSGLVELVIKGGSAAEFYKVKSGDQIIFY